ncbi:MAG: pyruvate ferredoxin/flavodoxin oxidoreductase [Puniceicoccaceae bacterium 5H]|nr:MAG: pyruvate ferredoxin/flavodoxin oxidoreductase [Puniceicoccaceae bacterium 5H]
MISPLKSVRKTLDANEAVASVAYRLSEIASIYPITPSSPMAEHCEEWAAAGKPNLWGDVPLVEQMQSEGGVAGMLHGSLMGGSLTTTFTASQGLLLMIPNMYKIAGELTPTVFHVSARALATHALSIFGDHSDVMACRATGFALLASGSVQEAQDMALIAHAATLRTRVPFLHFFDGFRTSHEINDIELLNDTTLEALIDQPSLDAFYQRALTPDAPTVRGTAQNPDTYFQAREAVNPFYRETHAAVAHLMERLGELTGREYAPFSFYGDPEAEDVLVLMGSGAETAIETAQVLNAQEGRKTGVLQVRLYRPFNTPAFLKALPKTVKRIAVLDRTKEPGSIGEPLYLDVALALRKAGCCQNVSLDHDPLLIGGRFGLGSKEFTPAMVRGVFDELASESPRDHFTVGINDDVTQLSVDYDRSFDIESPATTRAIFFGLGSDGTVGANKNTIKIIGENTDLHTQAYFVYDSKKSGGLTASHLRFGPEPIKAPYLIQKAQFIGCHQARFLGRIPILENAADGATVLINSPYKPEDVWDHLPRTVQEELIAKKIRLYQIDAYSLARELGLGSRINAIMQAAFFAISGLLPRTEAIAAIKKAIEKTYGRKGPKVVELNCRAVDRTVENLSEIPIPATATAEPQPITTSHWDEAPDFVKRITSRLLAGEGELLPVSAFPADGIWPTGTSRYEKRGIATALPVWRAEVCTQCNRCSLFCPHAALRPKAYDPALVAGAPEGFAHTALQGRNADGKAFTIQVSPMDCTGCGACVDVCPAQDADGRKALEMAPAEALLEATQAQYAFFQQLPSHVPDAAPTARNISFREPYFEFSGACAGCTQTPIVKMLTQLFGDRLLMANATGCSSIYGGNLPTTPYCMDSQGRGPAWANSLFEDNAEFGLGLQLAAEWRHDIAVDLLHRLRKEVGELLYNDIIDAKLQSPRAITEQRARIDALREKLQASDSLEAKRLLGHLDYLVPKTTWIVGGDGWAYDIGFGGLDHVLASGHNINILVLDTEVYSNTGGQASKSTPIGAQAKFATNGKERGKKDLAQIAMSYGSVYVGQIALGADERQALEVIMEAQAYEGPSLVIAYGPCQAHGIDLRTGPARQKQAVETGYWPLFRWDPRRQMNGEPALRLDSFEPASPVGDFMQQENRFRVIQRSNPERAAELLTRAQEQVDSRWKKLEALATGLDNDEDDSWS